MNSTIIERVLNSNQNTSLYSSKLHCDNSPELRGDNSFVLPSTLYQFSFNELEHSTSAYTERHRVTRGDISQDLYLSYPNHVFQLHLVFSSMRRMPKITKKSSKTIEEIEQTITTPRLLQVDKIEKQHIKRETTLMSYEIDDVPIEKYLQEYIYVEHVREFLERHALVEKVAKLDTPIGSKEDVSVESFPPLSDILAKYKTTRSNNPKEYFHGKTISIFFGGYSKTEKIEAVTCLEKVLEGEESKLSAKHLKILRQGSLGKLIAQWESISGKKIDDALNVKEHVDSSHSNSYVV